MSQLVVFGLDSQEYALDLSCVERIVRAVEVTHLPDAPDMVLGVINVEGRVIPVVNTRRRLGLPEREIQLNDLFVIATENNRTFALVADDVRPVLELPGQQVVSSGTVLPGKTYVQGVAKLEEGMVVILTADRILSNEQQASIEAAIEVMHEDHHG